MINSNNFESLYSGKKIEFKYLQWTETMLETLKNENQVVVMDKSQSKHLILAQSYYKMNLAGATEFTFTRKALLTRLNSALTRFPDNMGFIVFDAFRSRECQKSLFNFVAEDVKRRNPTYSLHEILSEAGRFVVNPENSSGYAVLPHNSGGAIDIGLHRNGVMLDFGSNFDEPTAFSATTFFEAEYQSHYGFSKERWLQIRTNRRILFHIMVELGFTNYRDEWWHYDLGDCMWSNELGIPWVFDSMEQEVNVYARNL